jgi:hypothetical protein
LKGIQAYLREVSKLKFDETPNYINLRLLLYHLDCGVKFYIAESKKMFFKAYSELILEKSVADLIAVLVKRKMDKLNMIRLEKIEQ